MQDLSLFQVVAVMAIPVLFAITLHEVAHGWVANWFGDPTAKMLGRLSLNPLKHVDPVGTVLVPLGLLIVANLAGAPPFLFGWAKPVPVTVQNLRDPRRDMSFVALAGPGANLAMALVWVFVIRVSLWLGDDFGLFALWLMYMGIAGIMINVVLMVLNLVPLPPLDGGRVMTSVLPRQAALRFARIEPYGIVILLVAMISGVLWRLIGPPIAGLNGLLFGLSGL